jgi:hypothetical protein
MNEEQKIVDCIRRLGSKQQEVVSGKVVAGSVNLSTYTCSVQLTHMDDGDTPLANVMLGAVADNGNGVLCIPADGSNVIVASVDGPGEYFLVQCSNLAKVVVTIGNTICQADAQGIVLNGGANGGIPITQHLVQRLNTIEQDLNTLKTAFKNWVVTPNDGGAALKAIAATWMANNLTQTQGSDIEDVKVKH